MCQIGNFVTLPLNKLKIHSLGGKKKKKNQPIERGRKLCFFLERERERSKQNTTFYPLSIGRFVFMCETHTGVEPEINVWRGQYATHKSYPFAKVSYNKYLKKKLASSIKVNTQNTNQAKQPISSINLDSPNVKFK